MCIRIFGDELFIPFMNLSFLEIIESAALAWRYQRRNMRVGITFAAISDREILEEGPLLSSRARQLAKIRK